MGRFASAKAKIDNMGIIRKALNYLIDLLDQGYSIESTINGKKVSIDLNTKDGLLIKIDGVLVGGIDSTGSFFADRIGTPINPNAYARIGQLSGAFGIELWDTNNTPDSPWLSIVETVAGGAEFYDKNNKLRFKIGDTGYSYICDENEVVRFVVYTDGRTEMRSDNLPNPYTWGVDTGGIYTVIGGVKTYRYT